MSAFDAHSARMLVIDDDRDMAELVGKLGHRLGFRCTLANNFDEFAAAYSNQISVILLDLFMPDVDGIEILRFLADNRSEAHIVLMSGNERSILNSARKLANELGLNVLGSIAKPFRLADLSEILQRHSPANQNRVIRHHNQPTAEELSDAIRNRHLQLHYQPQVDMRTGKCTGAEALCRWQRGDQMVSPDEFIGIAEKHGLISELTEEVIDISLGQLRAWKDEELDFTLSINISPAALRQVEFPETLIRKVQKHDLKPRGITLELTESTIAEDPARTLDILTRLRMKGFRLSIDDFGTGYSSLAQLARAPFTELKIDKSFVMGMAESNENLAIVRASIRLAQELGMDVVAEGVETPETLSNLEILDCDICQGYLFSKPLTAAKFGSWLKQFQKSGRALGPTTAKLPAMHAKA